MSNCINCGAYCDGDVLCITPYGNIPTCSDECLKHLKNSDAPLDDLQRRYLAAWNLSQEEGTDMEIIE